jgi:hypothetical protein
MARYTKSARGNADVIFYTVAHGAPCGSFTVLVFRQEHGKSFVVYQKPNLPSRHRAEYWGRSRMNDLAERE